MKKTPAQAARVQRESSVALYVQIAQRLAKDIAAGRYRAFERLPTERELVERYDVSRVTVRQAVARIIRQGLAVSKQGKGTFVAGPVVEHELEALRGFYDTLVGQGHSPQTRLVGFGPALPPEDVAILLRTEGQNATRLQRIYRLQKRPFALADAWLPPAALRVSRDDAERNPLYAILQNLLGFKVVRAEVSILARQADAEEARLLELEPTSPVLVMERTSYSGEGQALEISRFSIRPESYRFRLSVQGPLAITRQIQEWKAPGRAGKPRAAARKRNR